MFTAAKKQKQPRYPARDKWVNATGHIHKVDDYSSLKGNAGLIYAAAWVHSADIWYLKEARHNGMSKIVESIDTGRSVVARV